MPGAAAHLTPVLELGGKRPAIVHAWRTSRPRPGASPGRCSNSGQICIAADHVLVGPAVRDELVSHLKRPPRLLGAAPGRARHTQSSTRQFDRLAGYLAGTVAAGGVPTPRLYIAPTVLVDSARVTDHAGGVFGPILPVLEIDSVEKVIDWVNARPAPLGSTSSAMTVSRRRLPRADELRGRRGQRLALHPLVQQLPFGGVGNSAWASTTAIGDSRRSRTRAASCTTAL